MIIYSLISIYYLNGVIDKKDRAFVRLSVDINVCPESSTLNIYLFSTHILFGVLCRLKILKF